MSSVVPVVDDVRVDFAAFDGTLLACLAFGALMILYIQLIQVLRGRPKSSGCIFWCIVIYSSALFPLATLAVIGKIKFAEVVYVTNRLYTSGPKAYYIAHSEKWPNVMAQVSTTVLPWIADILMLYRLTVFWNYQRWIIIFPGLLYLAHVSISVPQLISRIRPNDIVWQSHLLTYKIISHSLCVSLNLVFTILICFRIFVMRDKAVKVLGKLQASFYSSSITTFIESGCLFTIWTTVYLITLLRDSWVEDVFLQPHSYILAITRMLIIMRMAQDRAWSKDIIVAAIDGELDWQISSTNTGSIVLHNLNDCESSNQLSPHKCIDSDDPSLSFNLKPDQ